MKTSSSTITTGQDLMDILSENIRRLRADEVTPAVANAITSTGSTMLRIAKLQMEYAKITGKTPVIPMLLT